VLLFMFVSDDTVTQNKPHYRVCADVASLR
jgi:hypothetical protein